MLCVLAIIGGALSVALFALMVVLAAIDSLARVPHASLQARKYNRRWVVAANSC